jgi:hypothetical protein
MESDSSDYSTYDSGLRSVTLSANTFFREKGWGGNNQKQVDEITVSAQKLSP